MKNYELLYLISGQYTDSEAESIRQKVNEQIKKYGGVVGYEENLGKKKLAYPIKKVLHGHYLVVEFELSDGVMLKNLINDLRLDKEILRSQIIAKAKYSPAKPSQRLQSERPVSTEQPEETKKETKKPAKDNKVSIENLNEKLDELLQDDSII